MLPAAVRRGRERRAEVLRFLASGAGTTTASLVTYVAVSPVLPSWAAWTAAYAVGLALALAWQRRWVYRVERVRPGAALAFCCVYVAQWAVGLAVVQAWTHGLDLPPALAPLAAVAVTTPPTYLATRAVLRRGAAG